MAEKKTGWRCAVCTYCGKCFEDPSEAKWTGTRCDVCTSCGKCMEAWGLMGGTDGDSGPTDWASAFKAMDDGKRGAPPQLKGAPGAV